MDISFDPGKRDASLKLRGLDFAEAGLVFAAQVAEREDRRRDYGERRFITAGMLRGRMVVIVWTPRDGARRIISMRHTHGREEVFWRSLD